ncbi:MAG: hypothetical protein MUP76_11515, partial [Acidimicrobiia bacterium]|nr:hypothetical protein [Acidimicrobiia bacterium]
MRRNHSRGVSLAIATVLAIAACGDDAVLETAGDQTTATEASATSNPPGTSETPPVTVATTATTAATTTTESP